MGNQEEGLPGQREGVKKDKFGSHAHMIGCYQGGNLSLTSCCGWRGKSNKD